MFTVTGDAKVQKATCIDAGDTSGDRYDIYVLMNPSPQELKWWNDVHCALHKSLSMIIPVDGHAKLRDNNCCLTQSQLQSLFFGKSYDPTIIDTSNTSSNEEKMALKKKLFCISEQVLASTQKVVFPNPVKRNGKDDSKKSNKLRDSTPSTQPADDKPLILDVSIGMRLLNAYRGIYKDKKLRLWNDSRMTAIAPSRSSLSCGSSSRKCLSAATDDTAIGDDAKKKVDAAAGSSQGLVTLAPGSTEWNARKLKQTTSG